MTQLEKTDSPVNHNHYATNKGILMQEPENSTTTGTITNDFATSTTATTITSATSSMASNQDPVSSEDNCCAGETSNGPCSSSSSSGGNTGNSQEKRPINTNGSFTSIQAAGSSKRARLANNSMASNKINSNSTPIPLPAPLTIGNTCGGDQSYLNTIDSEVTKFGTRSTSPRLVNSNFSFGQSSPKMPGAVGFQNLGNTCFMNSGLQCLLNTPPIVEFFLKSRDILGVAPPKGALTLSFQKLILGAWHGPALVMLPSGFKETLGNIYSQFKDCRQHDCQEFLALTLDILHEQLKLWNDAKRENNNENNETSSSGFASGPAESESASETVNESDVSSSLQSPGSNGGGDADIIAQEGSPDPKKAKLVAEENEPSSSGGKTARNSSSPLKEDSSSESENGPHMQMEDNDETGMESELENMDEGGDDGEKRVLKAKAKRAEGFWMNYIRDNNTVIASSFQGMYKSTVTCSVCNYVSCTYEPFMYLSLPIPRTTEREFDIMFSGAADFQVNKVNVTMNIHDTVGQLKEKVITKVFEEIQLSVPPLTNFVVAEVVNYQIHSILKDDQPLKNVKDGIHNVYVLELNQDYFPESEVSCIMNGVGEIETADNLNSELTPTTYLDMEENWEPNDFTPISVPGNVPERGGFITADLPPTEGESSEIINSEVTGELVSCNVCLEDLPKSKLKQHFGCSCILCLECMLKTAECSNFTLAEKNADKTETKLKCPVCNEIVDYKKDFISLVSAVDGPRKMNLIPVLFYYNPNKDSNNNNDMPISSAKFIGHPLIIQLPSTLSSDEFHQTISKVVPFPETEYFVKNATWNGKECGVCVYNRSCPICEFPKTGIIAINSRNSILISYSDLSADLIASVEPFGMKTCSNPYGWNPANAYKEEPIIDIQECLDAFSQVEHLDEQNPWFCPGCKKNQCATKSLTICRFPDYLIVYLKRFVFMDHSSNKLNNKLKFPINDFDVSKYIAEEFAGGEHIYDLYSCVCHFGTASGGHYTSYSKNPKFDSWHYFNDDTVTNKCPSKDEFASAYVLFYAKKGLKSDIPLKRMQAAQPFNFSIVEIDSGSKECDTTSILPDCTFDETEGIGSYGAQIGPVNFEGPCNQEDIISSTSSLLTDPLGDCKSTENNYSVSASASSDKINCVRETVSNLCIDVNSTYTKRKRLSGFSSSPSSSSSSATCTATSSNAPSYFDEFEEECQSIKPYAEFSIENKRLTKVAQRSKFSHSAQAPNTSGFPSSRKQLQ